MLIVDRVAGDFNDDGRIGTHGSISAVSSDPRTKRIAFDNYQRIGQDRTQEGIALEVRHRLTVNKKKVPCGTSHCLLDLFQPCYGLDCSKKRTGSPFELWFLPFPPQIIGRGGVVLPLRVKEGKRSACKHVHLHTFPIAVQ